MHLIYLKSHLMIQRHLFNSQTTWDLNELPLLCLQAVCAKGREAARSRHSNHAAATAASCCICRQAIPWVLPHPQLHGIYMSYKRFANPLSFFAVKFIYFTFRARS